MRVGIDQRIITPELGVDLAGFGRANRKATGVHDDLYLSTMIIEQDEEKVTLLCADIIGFGLELEANIKKDIKDKFNINEDKILLCASHTHSGPQTAENMLAVGSADSKYLEYLRRTVLESIQDAMNSTEDMELYYGKGECNIGINRRHIVNGKAEFEPTEQGALDKEVIAVKFIKDGKIKAVLYNYACHPSTIDSDYISGDYAGKARGVIKENLGSETVVLFLQGCCGNIRVRAIKDDQFRAGTWEDVDNFGNQVGRSVTELCKGDMKKIDTNISAELIKITLPLEKIPETDELEGIKLNGNPHEKIWAHNMLSRYDSLRKEVPFTVQRLSLSNEFSIIALSGEVCVEYGLYLKKNSNGRTVVPAAYSNGVVGYIPTEEMFEQGGYEPDRSTIYYGLPSKFDKSIEEKVLKVLDRINK